jgi:two-component system sensor histidine kinase BaeS
VPVRPLLASVARDLEARATAAGITVTLEEAGKAAVDADPDRLRQVVAALLDNAIRHTQSGGRIQVGARPEAPSQVVISVTDNGPGIDPDDLPHVFERFYQADPSRDRAIGSSGLGLAIVRALVEAHGGRVSVSSDPGAGARFEVRLPAAS